MIKDRAFIFITIYALLYFIFLKILPVTVGAITLAFFFVFIIDAMSSILMRFFKIRRGLSVAISSVAFFGILSYSIYGIFPIIFTEGREIFKFVINTANKPIQEIFPGLEGKSLEIFETFLDRLSIWLGDTFEKVVSYIVGKIPDALTASILLLIASSYISYILPKLGAIVAHAFPKETLPRTRRFLKNVYEDLRKFTASRIVTALLVGVIVGIGFKIMGMKHSLFLGILSGLTDFIPYLGVVIVSIPALFIAFTSKGLWGIIGVLVVLTVANQLETWIFIPKMMGDKLNINWFIVLIGIIAFGELYGVLGVLMAVPYLVFFKDFWLEYVDEILHKNIT
ncbi:MAG: hypothetical protein DRP25_00835 [Thermotoga sp.]|nr:MAG: hypothetical protein DRP25_00835 [Thermotoga sp.]